MAGQDLTGQDLSGRTALVTGSTSGIGQATAAALAQRGAHVLVTGRDAQRGTAVVDAIRADGGKADFVQADLRDAASARDLAGRATEAAGGRIDILVNNAGGGAFGATAGFGEDVFDATFGTNVKAPFYLVGAIAPGMAERGQGAIVNVSTMAAQFGMPGMAVYGGSKAALNLMTKSWAAEFGPQRRPGQRGQPRAHAHARRGDDGRRARPAGRTVAGRLRRRAGRHRRRDRLPGRGRRALRAGCAGERGRRPYGHLALRPRGPRPGAA